MYCIRVSMLNSAGLVPIVLCQHLSVCTFKYRSHAPPVLYCWSSLMVCMLVSFLFYYSLSCQHPGSCLLLNREQGGILGWSYSWQVKHRVSFFPLSPLLSLSDWLNDLHVIMVTCCRDYLSSGLVIQVTWCTNYSPDVSRGSICSIIRGVRIKFLISDYLCHMSIQFFRHTYKLNDEK